MSVVPSEETEEETHPPVIHHTHPSDGTTRPTIKVRPLVKPKLWRGHPGFSLDSLYVRRYWTAAIGPTALCDLLRLARAGASGKPIPLPDRLSVLLSLGLAHRDGSGGITVADRLPAVPRHLLDRYPPPLRREHREYLQSIEHPVAVSAAAS